MIDILYVDDEDALLEICKIFLEMSGDLKVDTSSSVNDAFTMMKKNHYDVIVSDYQMPVIDGLKFLKMVRERDGKLPFILFTGRGREEIVIEAYNSGASFYVQKGGDPNSQFVDLEQKIKQAVGKNKAEEALKDSERRFRSLIEKAPLAIAIVRDGMLKYVNEACVGLFGYQEDIELLSCPLNERFDQASFDMIKGTVPVQVLGGQDVVGTQFEADGTRADGTKFNMMVSANPMDLNDGKAKILFLTDITDRKRTEEGARISNLQGNMLMDLTRSATWEFDARSNLMTFNDRFYSLMGTEADSEGGYQMSPEDYFKRFVHPDDITRISMWMWKDLAAVGQELFSENEHKIIRPDGNVRNFFVRVGAVRNQTGRVVRLYGVVQDITGKRYDDVETIQSGDEISPFGTTLTI